MSRFFVGLALWALLLALAACGGDSKGTDPAMDTELADDSLTESILDKDSDSAKDAEPSEKVDKVVPTFDGLPACTGDLNGKTAYVEDEDSAYVCKKGLWVVDDSLTKAIQPDSEEKSSSSAKAKSSSNKASDSSSSDKSPSSSSAVKTSSSSRDGKSNSSDEEISSSSSIVSSNSSSSSVAVAKACKTATEDKCVYGTLTDSRDKQTYKTVQIGDQWWMAENLKYETKNSYCYEDKSSNCDKYGRLYTWAAAMDSAGIIPGNTANGCGYGEICNLGNVKVRGVCPEGWHLPSRDEWDTLLTAVGGKATAGTMLKSTEGWNDKDDGTSGNGSDAYSFSALPAGDRNGNGNFLDEGSNAYFWSSTESDNFSAYYMYLYYINVNAYLYLSSKYYGFSVRCLKD